MNYLILLTKNTSSLPIFGPIWNLIVTFLGLVMNAIYSFLAQIGIPNIGLSIILFTLVTRIILAPTYQTAEVFSDDANYATGN